MLVDQTHSPSTPTLPHECELTAQLFCVPRSPDDGFSKELVLCEVENPVSVDKVYFSFFHVPSPTHANLINTVLLAPFFSPYVTKTESTIR